MPEFLLLIAPFYWGRVKIQFSAKLNALFQTLIASPIDFD